MGKTKTDKQPKKAAEAKNRYLSKEEVEKKIRESRKAMEAAAIQQADGVSIAINVDQLGRLHYVMSFDSWADWGKLQDTPSPKWTAFMGKFQANPPGKVVQTFLARQLPQ